MPYGRSPDLIIVHASKSPRAAIGRTMIMMFGTATPKLSGAFFEPPSHRRGGPGFGRLQSERYSGQLISAIRRRERRRWRRLSARGWAIGLASWEGSREHLRWSGIYLFRFSKVKPAKAIPTKMIPASASVRIVLRAMPRPKCATTTNIVATITAVPSTKIGTINRIIPPICSGLG